MHTAEFDLAVVNVYDGLKPAALKLTSDMDEANDLIQETIRKALSNRDKFRSGTNLQGWLYTIMRNTFITQYNRTARRKTLIDSSDNQYLLNSSTMTVDNEGGSSLVMQEIQGEIRRLDEGVRRPFEMYFRGYKYKEIADILHIPIGTVKNKIHLARKELKVKLKRYDMNEATS